MEILGSIMIGAVAAGLVPLVFKTSKFALAPTLAVGILGGLLGLATDTWLGSDGMTDLAFCEYIAAGVGAVLALFVWIVAHRLFFDDLEPMSGD